MGAKEVRNVDKGIVYIISTVLIVGVLLLVQLNITKHIDAQCAGRPYEVIAPPTPTATPSATPSVTLKPFFKSVK